MQSKRVPLRKCIGCGEMKPKKELLRIVRSPDGQVGFDPCGRLPGRGAYLCRNVECLRAAQKRHSLERSFSCKIEPEVYEVMANALAEADGNS